ncbi:hypothetical protein H2198_002678 [Neophaeococcomyces mojaviensis]|uniref:Uncharacterized protein n=1 Tax=Neophaeococcomyces mojaviensis TaxID=3383035 RepID=A0ACC3ADU7_9EURO|nr:hypothetical protein H2198_002678 [Knufia sp. JES_112]
MTAVCVGRSRAAPHFWRHLVPQAAYTYPCVRHALLATAIANESLINRESTTVGRKSSELQVFSHTSKAIRSLLTENVPVDVVLLASATLGIMDVFNGHWNSACTHVTSGAKLAKQARLDPRNDRYISFYCEAFASALPSILKLPGNGVSHCPPEKNSVVRLNEAVQSLRLAQISFEEAIPKVQKQEGDERNRMMYVIRNAKAETTWLLERWQALHREEIKRTSPPDDEMEINLHRIESPFSTIMSELNTYLDHGGAFDIAKFEVAMERTMPFYSFAKAGPNVKMREDAAELMCHGSEMRGRGARFPASGSRVHKLALAPKLDDDND